MEEVKEVQVQCTVGGGSPIAMEKQKVLIVQKCLSHAAEANFDPKNNKKLGWICRREGRGLQICLVCLWCRWVGDGESGVGRPVRKLTTA